MGNETKKLGTEIDVLKKRIEYLETITPKHANYFYSFFKGRTDVYSKRSGKPNPKTGKTGYYTQCWNYWKNGLCPKREGKQIKCGNCENQKYKSLTGNDLLMHLRGDREDCSDIFPAIIRQTFDVAIYDICSKKRSKTEPVCFCGIKETVERVLGKRFLKRAGLLLHIHTSSDKNVTEFVTKQRNRRNTFFFHAITSGKKFTDMVFRKKISERSQLGLFHQNGFVVYWTWHKSPL